MARLGHSPCGILTAHVQVLHTFRSTKGINYSKKHELFFSASIVSVALKCTSHVLHFLMPYIFLCLTFSYGSTGSRVRFLFDFVWFSFYSVFILFGFN